MEELELGKATIVYEDQDSDIVEETPITNNSCTLATTGWSSPGPTRMATT